MSDEDICGAETVKTGEPCQRTPKAGFDRCYQHRSSGTDRLLSFSPEFSRRIKEYFGPEDIPAIIAGAIFGVILSHDPGFVPEVARWMLYGSGAGGALNRLQNPRKSRSRHPYGGRLPEWLAADTLDAFLIGLAVIYTTVYAMHVGLNPFEVLRLVGFYPV